MLKKDNIFVGIITGIAFPVIFFFVLHEVNDVLKEGLMPEGFSDRLIAIVAVCTNFFPFLAYNFSNKVKAMRGILGTTIVLAFVVIIFYFDSFIE